MNAADSADAASKPGGEGLLVGETARVHWAEFRREQFCIAAAYAEHDQCACIPEHCGTHCRRELVGVLVRETEMRRELAGLGKQ